MCFLLQDENGISVNIRIYEIFRQKKKKRQQKIFVQFYESSINSFKNGEKLKIKQNLL